METLDLPILLSRSFEKCVVVFVSGILSNLCPFFRVSVIHASRRLCDGFKSLDHRRERFTALFASSLSFPDREETCTWSGNHNFFLVAECARGCYVLHNA